MENRGDGRKFYPGAEFIKCIDPNEGEALRTRGYVHLQTWVWRPLPPCCSAAKAGPTNIHSPPIGLPVGPTAVPTVLFQHEIFLFRRNFWVSHSTKITQIRHLPIKLVSLHVSKMCTNFKTEKQQNFRTANISSFRLRSEQNKPRPIAYCWSMLAFLCQIIGSLDLT